MSETVTLRAERLYLIRSTKTNPEGLVSVRYYETPSMWNKSPLEATLFQNFESGEGHLRMYHERDKAKLGWADGSKEVLDVVPLYGELLQSPNGKKVTLPRKRP